MPRSCVICGGFVADSWGEPQCVNCGRPVTPARPPTAYELTDVVRENAVQMSTIHVLDHEREAWRRAGIALPG